MGKKRKRKGEKIIQISKTLWPLTFWAPGNWSSNSSAWATSQSGKSIIGWSMPWRFCHFESFALVGFLFLGFIASTSWFQAGIQSFFVNYFLLILFSDVQQMITAIKYIILVMSHDDNFITVRSPFTWHFDINFVVAHDSANPSTSLANDHPVDSRIDTDFILDETFLEKYKKYKISFQRKYNPSKSR